MTITTGDPMLTLSENDKVDLEKMIDRVSLEHVLRALSEICAGKAQHIDENWAQAFSTVEKPGQRGVPRDRDAVVWERMAGRLETEADTANKYLTTSCR